jgi:hypothetical protein
VFAAARHRDPDPTCLRALYLSLHLTYVVCGRFCSLLLPRGGRFARQGFVQASVVWLHHRQLIPLSHCWMILLVSLGLLACQVLHL